MKSVLKILAFIPCCIHLLFLAFISQVAYIVWPPHILALALLTLTGIGTISKKKIVQVIGSIALIVLTICLCIMGYYDYFQWFSTIIGVILFIYFVSIKLLVKKLKIA